MNTCLILQHSNYSGRKKRNTEVDNNEVNVDKESEYVFPFIERIGEMGITNLYKNKDCQQRLFCDMAQYGYKNYRKEYDDVDTPNMIQKTFNFISHT